MGLSEVRAPLSMGEEMVENDWMAVLVNKQTYNVAQAVLLSIYWGDGHM